jgi:hypothetical protein
MKLRHESGQLLDVLSEVGLPSLTHHLVETLQVFIPSAVQLSLGAFEKHPSVARKSGWSVQQVASSITGCANRE